MMHRQPHLTLLKKISFLFLIPLLTFSALYATNPLSVELLLPKQKTSNGAVTIVMTNTSAKDIKILKWNTPLEKNLNANIFTIKNNKSTIKYVGVLVKRGKPTEEDYLLFKAGEKRTATVDLPTYYQMDKEGSYTVTYHGSFKQQIPNKNKTTSKKCLKTSQPSVTISFTPTQKKVVSYSQKVSANFNECSTDQVNILNNAHDASVVIARDASDTMDSAEANTEGERYKTWFGAADNTRQTTIKTHFNNIYNALENEQVIFDCNCSAVTTPNKTFAYVYPAQPYSVHICGAFWKANLTGTDSQAGTIVHETSHFTVVASTDDHVYGQVDAKKLAISTPENAIQNADSHEFFAENTPALTMNDPFMTAETIRGIENINLSGTISASGDKTIYVFTAQKTGSYTFYTSGSLDTRGTLYNSDRIIILYNDDMNTSAKKYNFKITAKLVQGQTYYLRVNAYRTNTGDYVLKSSFRTSLKNDSNRDAIADILWRKDNINHLWYMQADGSHTYKNIGTKSTTYTLVGTGDLNGDGITDILWKKGVNNYIWYMHEDGSHAYKQIDTKSYTMMGIADFNNDGIDDILWRKDNINHLWYMQADGSHTYKNIGTKSTTYTLVGTGDLNGDGITDILWKKGVNNYIWYMHEDGSHAYKQIDTKSYTMMGIADFNNDGIDDILWRKDNINHLWYMQADGSHTYKNIGTKSTTYTLAKIADYNGDGITDILWRKGYNTYIWYMHQDGGHDYKKVDTKGTAYAVQ